MTKKRGILPRIFVGKGKKGKRTIGGRIFGFLRQINLRKEVAKQTGGRKPSWGKANPELVTRKKRKKKAKIVRPKPSSTKAKSGTKIMRGQGFIGPAKSMNLIKLKDHSIGVPEQKMREFIARHGQNADHLGPAMVTVVYNSLIRGKKKEN